MNNNCARSLVLSGWIIAALGFHAPLRAYAANHVDLISETASIDTGAPSSPLASAADSSQSSDSSVVQSVQPATKVSESGSAAQPLQGGVSKLRQLLDATESTDLYKIAVGKLQSGVKLSAEEYRSLGAGCIGYESDRQFFQDIAVVSIVYRGSPADLAGIKVGDKLLDHDPGQDANAKDHPEIPRWKVTCGQEGTQTQVTVLRHKKPVTLTLTRMNIEDISESRYRHEWERLLAQLGNPASGEFEGDGHNP